MINIKNILGDGEGVIVKIDDGKGVNKKTKVNVNKKLVKDAEKNVTTEGTHNGKKKNGDVVAVDLQSQIMMKRINNMETVIQNMATEFKKQKNRDIKKKKIKKKSRPLEPEKIKVSWSNKDGISCLHDIMGVAAKKLDFSNNDTNMEKYYTRYLSKKNSVPGSNWRHYMESVAKYICRMGKNSSCVSEICSNPCLTRDFTSNGIIRVCYLYNICRQEFIMCYV